MSFSLQISDFVKKAGANADLVVRKVGIEVFASVVRKTPVDTGRARANWVASVGTPSAEVTGALDSAPVGSNPGGALSAKANTALAAAKAGTDVWITNSLPYIQKLEDGSSAQAPAGMVAVTAVEWQDHVRKATEGLP